MHAPPSVLQQCIGQGTVRQHEKNQKNRVFLLGCLGCKLRSGPPELPKSTPQRALVRPTGGE
eukprot:10441881-Karenia_brevis.AAC.1